MSTFHDYVHAISKAESSTAALLDVECDRADVGVGAAERERIDRLPRREVDHFEMLLIGALDVEPLRITGQAHRPREAPGCGTSALANSSVDGDGVATVEAFVALGLVNC